MAISRDLFRKQLVTLLGVALFVGCAAFPFPNQSVILVALMLFLPLLESQRTPAMGCIRVSPGTAALAAITAAILFFYPEQFVFALSAFIWAALPEEWYFRRYLLLRWGGGHIANGLVTLVFSLSHGLIWGWDKGISVILPSLLFGLLYQRNRDLLLVVFAHGLANLVYVIWLQSMLQKLIG